MDGKDAGSPVGSAGSKLETDDMDFASPPPLLKGPAASARRSTCRKEVHRWPIFRGRCAVFCDSCRTFQKVGRSFCAAKEKENLEGGGG